jgi:CHASE1-domain containing sensor protein
MPGSSSVPSAASRLLSGVSQAGVVAAFAALFFAAERVPREPAQTALEDRTAAVARALERAVDDALRVLSQLGGELTSEDPPDWRSFSRTLRDEAGALAPGTMVAWAPVVPGSSRPEYEERTGRDAYRSFRIAERDPDGHSMVARPRDEHLPVHLVNPLPENDELLGFDLEARPELGSAIDRARRTGEPQAVAPWSFGFGDRRDTRVLVMLPVFQVDGTATRPTTRFGGVIVASLPWDPIVAAAGGGPDARGGEVTLRLLPLPIDDEAAHAGTEEPDLSRARSALFVGEQQWALEVVVEGRAARLLARRPR